MLKLIAGKKGSGKTKQLIALVNEAVETSNGKVVCIEKGTKLTYDINHGARLLDTDTYHVSGYDAFYGFLAGIAASDYDVKDLFVDSILKIAGDDYEKIGHLLEKVEAIFESDVNIVLTISAEEKDLPESVRKYIRS